MKRPFAKIGAAAFSLAFLLTLSGCVQLYAPDPSRNNPPEEDYSGENVNVRRQSCGEGRFFRLI